jgi:hypothetical protein
MEEPKGFEDSEESVSSSVPPVEPPPLPEEILTQMKKELKGWGIGLIVIGAISIVLSGFLDPIWGGLLILIGVLTLIIQKRGMFIVIGIGLLLAGLLNILSGGLGGWTVFGIVQIYWGVQEIRKFSKYSI